MKRRRVDPSALCQDAEKSFFFFQPFSSWHTGEVCEIMFEVHLCAHFKVHRKLPACILSETRGGDTGFLSGGTMENEPGKKTQTLINTVLHTQPVHHSTFIPRRHHAHYLMRRNRALEPLNPFFPSFHIT